MKAGPQTNQISLPPQSQQNYSSSELNDISHILPHRLSILPASLFTQRAINVSGKSLSERKFELLWSYLPDWKLTSILAVAFFFLKRICGHQREFDLNDPTIQYSYVAHAWIPVHLLVILSEVLPVIFIVLCSQLVLRSSWDTHTGLLGLALSHCFSLVTTTIIKLTTGRPRPDFLSRCEPLPELVQQQKSSLGLSNSSICSVSSESKVLRDGFRGFPSGHASTAWAGLGFLSFYFAGKLHLSEGGGHTIKLWIAGIPSFTAGLIAITRTMDNRHHDIVIGSVIGLTSTWFSYRFYYPILSSKNCHHPYPPRLKASLPHTGHYAMPDISSSVPDISTSSNRVKQEAGDITQV